MMDVIGWNGLNIDGTVICILAKLQYSEDAVKGDTNLVRINNRGNNNNNNNNKESYCG